jgi:hypothetical protein
MTTALSSLPSQSPSSAWTSPTRAVVIAHGPVRPWRRTAGAGLGILATLFDLVEQPLDLLTLNHE